MRSPILGTKIEAQEYQTLKVRKLTPYIGAELSGVDLSQTLSDQVIGEIRRALLENLVIFFRDQILTFEQHVALGRRFGDLVKQRPQRLHIKEHPEILLIQADENSKWITAEYWHSDMTCIEKPHLGCILRLEEVPKDGGGDTLWSNMYLAYEALSDDMKRFLLGLTAIHGGSEHYAEPMKTAASQEPPEIPQSEHPLICTHPETGRHFLYVNRVYTKNIVQLKPEESAALLQFLYRHIETLDFFVRFQWQKNSVAFWDNRCTQHHAVWDYFPQRRRGVRVAIKGEERPAYLG